MVVTLRKHKSRQSSFYPEMHLTLERAEGGGGEEGLPS